MLSFSDGRPIPRRDSTSADLLHKFENPLFLIGGVLRRHIRLGVAEHRLRSFDPVGVPDASCVWRKPLNSGPDAGIADGVSERSASYGEEPHVRVGFNVPCENLLSSHAEVQDPYPALVHHLVVPKLRLPYVAGSIEHARRQHQNLPTACAGRQQEVDDITGSLAYDGPHSVDISLGDGVTLGSIRSSCAPLLESVDGF